MAGVQMILPSFTQAMGNSSFGTQDRIYNCYLGTLAEKVGWYGIISLKAKSIHPLWLLNTLCTFSYFIFFRGLMIIWNAPWTLFSLRSEPLLLFNFWWPYCVFVEWSNACENEYLVDCSRPGLVTALWGKEIQHYCCATSF